MSGVATTRAGPDRVLLSLLALTALAWVLAWLATADGDMAGGMAAGAFLIAWVPMVAAMMLPSVIPTARLWLRVLSREPAAPARRMLHLAGFVVGYLAVWTATGLPAWGLAVLGDHAGMHDSPAVHAVQGGIIAAAGVYQLSPLKRVCLSHCRSPVASLLHYASWSAPARNLRVGLAHGAYCTGCCWGLMAVMAVVAAMDLRLAAVMTVAVLLEKWWRHGERFAVALGLALLALAPAVMFGGVLVGSM